VVAQAKHLSAEQNITFHTCHRFETYHV